MVVNGRLPSPARWRGYTLIGYHKQWLYYLEYPNITLYILWIFGGVFMGIIMWICLTNSTSIIRFLAARSIKRWCRGNSAKPTGIWKKITFKDLFWRRDNETKMRRNVPESYIIYVIYVTWTGNRHSLKKVLKQ